MTLVGTTIIRKSGSGQDAVLTSTHYSGVDLLPILFGEVRGNVKIERLKCDVLAAQQGGFSGPSATQTQSGGFQGPNGSSTTVESAKSLRDDTWVTLRGNIVERISDDLYVFKDATGTINVDIDHKRWNGVTVTPQDTVEIQGEVDKDWNSVEIDVKQITKVSK